MKHLSRLLLAVLICLPFSGSGHSQTLGLSPAGTDKPVAPFVALATDFDGTNDFFLRGADLTGAVDDNQGVFSVWFRIDAGDGTIRVINDSTSARFQGFFGSSNNANTRLENQGNTIIFQDNTNATITASANWHHMMWAWDMDVPTCLLYIDDVQHVVDETCTSNGTVDGTNANWGVAASVAGSVPWNGCLAEFYYHQTTFLDLTIENNRRLFNDGTGGIAGGKPVNLGSDGSTPTSSQPIVYLKGQGSGFGINSGTGGNFVVNGVPVNCSTSPSD